MKAVIAVILVASVAVVGCYTMQTNTVEPVAVQSPTTAAKSSPELPTKEIVLEGQIAKTAPRAPASAPPSPMIIAPPQPQVETQKKPIPMVPRRNEVKPAQSKPQATTEDWIGNLQQANMVLSVPDTANIDEDVRVELVLSLQKAMDELRKDISESGVQHADVILVSRILEVQITAPDFDVKPITPTRQLLSSTKTNSWKWTLRAKSSGVHSIDVSVTAVVELSGARTEHHIKTFNKRVDIEITAQQLLSQWFSKYWQWLATTIIIPLFLWWFKSRRKSTSAT